jgi:hypothetical protein
MMEDVDGSIEKIMGYKTWSDRRKIDALLEMDADLYCNLGIDSSKTQRREVQKCSRKIYKAISEINKLEGLQYLQYLKDYTQ